VDQLRFVIVQAPDRCGLSRQLQFSIDFEF